MFTVTCSWDFANRAREKGREGYPLLAHHKERINRLMKNRTLPAFQVEDVLHAAGAPLGFYHCGAVEQLTGHVPFYMHNHPGQKKEAWGGDHTETASIALAVIRMWQLGMRVHVETMCEPVRKRISDKKAHPYLSHSELSVWWHKHIGTGAEPLPFCWSNSESPPERPYAIRLVNGLVCVGFCSRLGGKDEHYEVIGKPGKKLESKAIGLGMLPIYHDRTFAAWLKRTLAEHDASQQERARPDLRVVK